MATAEGIVERLELSINNAQEQIRVWWGEVKDAAKGIVKDTIETTKDFLLGPGSISNFSHKTIYAIMDDRIGNQPLDSLVRSVPSGTILQGYIDGVVDVEGRQVYKMNENTHLTFDGVLFVTSKSSLEIEGVLNTHKEHEFYGVYIDNVYSGNFKYKGVGYAPEIIFEWWQAAKNYSME